MANPATPLPKRSESVHFSTRHLRADLLDGLRVAVALGAAQNVEDAVNKALAAGLPVLRGDAEVKWLRDRPATTTRRRKKPHPLRHAK